MREVLGRGLSRIHRFSKDGPGSLFGGEKQQEWQQGEELGSPAQSR